MRISCCCNLFFFATALAHAQSTTRTNSAVVGAGYSVPSALNVAPGQVITVYVAGLTTVTTPVQAQTVPVPSTLGSVSAAWFLLGSSSKSVPVPILSLRPVSAACGVLGDLPTPCGSYVAATVQVPFEVPANVFGTLTPTIEGYIQFSESGKVASSATSYGLLDQIHVLTGKDSLFIAPGPALLPRALAFHVDGTQVGWRSPAHSGEAVTMYAVGLGNILGAMVATGTANSTPIAVNSPIVSFDFHVNAGPSMPTGSSLHADYAGFVAGFVGLYQVNLTIPAVPQDIALCTTDGQLAGDTSAVYSNLTIDLRGAASFDGAGICVTP